MSFGKYYGAGCHHCDSVHLTCSAATEAHLVYARRVGRTFLTSTGQEQKKMPIERSMSVCNVSIGYSGNTIKSG